MLVHDAAMWGLGSSILSEEKVWSAAFLCCLRNSASILKSDWKVMLLWGLGVVLQCHRKPSSAQFLPSVPAGGVWCSVLTHTRAALASLCPHLLFVLSVTGPAQIFVLVTIYYCYCRCQSVIDALHQHTARSFTVAAVHGLVLLNRKMTHWTIAQLDYKRCLFWERSYRWDSHPC